MPELTPEQQIAYHRARAEAFMEAKNDISERIRTCVDNPEVDQTLRLAYVGMMVKETDEEAKAELLANPRHARTKHEAETAAMYEVHGVLFSHERFRYFIEARDHFIQEFGQNLYSDLLTQARARMRNV